MAGSEDKKRLYDETASLVADLGLRGRITEDEMLFLLSLLDQVMIKENYPQLIQLLHKWTANQAGSEMNEIIKATVLNLEFSNPQTMQDDLELLQELLATME
ncbi:hypothetical protein [Syntrophomonas palmitatica]|uniref:hypothetical protein n=1 Tax=Syntrophomonas palmitatica TaxID=402877 RepID=UPI0006D020F4|nr:hypothetical protein [Syntrophomonas palmitatica]